MQTDILTTLRQVSISEIIHAVDQGSQNSNRTGVDVGLNVKADQVEVKIAKCSRFLTDGKKHEAFAQATFVPVCRGGDFRLKELAMRVPRDEVPTRVASFGKITIDHYGRSNQVIDLETGASLWHEKRKRIGVISHFRCEGTQPAHFELKVHSNGAIEDAVVDISAYIDSRAIGDLAPTIRREVGIIGGENQAVVITPRFDIRTKALIVTFVYGKDILEVSYPLPARNGNEALLPYVMGIENSLMNAFSNARLPSILTPYARIPVLS